METDDPVHEPAPEGPPEPDVGRPESPAPDEATAADRAPDAEFASLAAAAPPLTVDPVFDAALARDLSRGRRVAALTWLIALCHAVLGLVSVQQAALLVNVDRHLATTPDIEACIERLEQGLRMRIPEITALFIKPQAAATWQSRRRASRR